MSVELALMLAVLAACAPSDTTVVRLTVSYEPAWALDELSVAVGERAERTEPRRELRVLLPDDMAGRVVTIEVGGWRDGVRMASGTAEVTPVRSGTVEAEVALSLVSCEAWCVPGERECRGDAVVVCEQGNDGCPAWGAPMVCDDDAPFCSLGMCRADCVDECEAGETRCEGPTLIRTCGHGDADDCLEWLAPEACADGDVCAGGACVRGCTDACAAGAAMCAGDGVRTCGDGNMDGCTEWGPTVSCAGGCEAGACVDTCTPCDVLEQCGCAAGMACDANWTTGDTLCRSVGSGGAEAPCTALNECMAGFSCWYGACRPWCDEHAACDSGVCVVWPGFADAGLCGSDCDVVTSAGCAAGMGCRLGGGVLFCTASGAGGQEAPCPGGEHEDCLPGYSCFNITGEPTPLCVKNCRTNADCSGTGHGCQLVEEVAGIQYGGCL